METKISAVEWYENRIFILQIQLEKKEISLGEYAVKRVELFKQAKAMEKEQIMNAYWDGGQDVPIHVSTCKKYYEETFKSE